MSYINELFVCKTSGRDEGQREERGAKGRKGKSASWLSYNGGSLESTSSFSFFLSSALAML